MDQIQRILVVTSVVFMEVSKQGRSWSALFICVINVLVSDLIRSSALVWASCGPAALRDEHKYCQPCPSTRSLILSLFFLFPALVEPATQPRRYRAMLWALPKLFFVSLCVGPRPSPMLSLLLLVSIVPCFQSFSLLLDQATAAGCTVRGVCAIDQGRISSGVHPLLKHWLASCLSLFLVLLAECCSAPSLIFSQFAGSQKAVVICA